MTSESKRDNEFKSLFKEIKDFSIALYCIVKGSTFSWSNRGTASISIKGNNLHFEFNTKFWDKLNAQEKMFLILHEIYHVFLDHFGRLELPITPIKNVAADLANNSSLLKHFSFDEDDLPFLRKNGCWPDTIIPGKPLSADLSAEEYLYILDKNKSGMEGGKGQGKGDAGMDDHSKIDPGKMKDFLDKALSELKDDLKDSGMSEEEAKQQIENLIETIPDIPTQENFGVKAGVGTTGSTKLLNYDRKRKTTWVQFAKFLKKSTVGDNDDIVWLPDRRTQHLAQNDMFLPTYKDRTNKNGKICVVLYLDTSYSCYSLRPKFFGFAKALPKDIFEVVAFGFTDTVYKIDLNNPYFRSGGTSFNFEPSFSKIVNPRKYGFVFTDGEASKPRLSEPQRWHWFLSGSQVHNIPTGCIIHKLKDFE